MTSLAASHRARITPWTRTVVLGAIALAIALLAADLPPDTAPAHAESIMAPRLIELCFQTAGIWQITAQQQMALPLSIESVTTYRQPAAAQGRIYAIATTKDGESFEVQVVDEAGNVHVDLRGYRTVALPVST